jgi:mono/diheme cytochrome c family protein
MSARPAVRFIGWVILILVIALVLMLGLLGWNLSHASALPAQPVTAVAAAKMLSQPIPDTTPNAAQVRKGQYLVAAGDCMSCHLRAEGEPFAGGLGLNTPFGVIYSSNISSDTETGIGNWTPDQFYRAMHEGISDHGNHLYPAFPYPWFNRVTREDTDAILAYLKTTPGVKYRPPANKLPFPLNIRMAVGGWNLLFLKQGTFKPDPKQSEEWNRGAYLVNGLGHCSACHTPKNMFGADKTEKAFHGGVLEDFVAPDLTGNPRTGLGSWSLDDITEYLHTGRNARAGAGGPMADVITYSTSLMTDADRHAMAVYLKSLPASPDEAVTVADAGAMKRGAEIYSDACTGCHLENGVGQPRFFPPLGKNSMVQQNDPTGLIHLILAGGRIGPSPTRPSPLTMPSFAWKLTDQEIADVSTYLRNSWGNQASAVPLSKVQKQRKRLDLESVHLTDNSGDQLGTQ